MRGTQSTKLPVCRHAHTEAHARIHTRTHTHARTHARTHAHATNPSLVMHVFLCSVCASVRVCGRVHLCMCTSVCAGEDDKTRVSLGLCQHKHSQLPAPTGWTHAVNIICYITGALLCCTG